MEQMEHHDNASADTPFGSGQRRRYCATQHTSRREIDMAIGAYMALRACPEGQARYALIQAARGAGVGLGAVSQALLAWVGDPTMIVGSDPAREYWESHLS